MNMLSVITCVAMLIPAVASAELLVYKGTAKESYTGEANLFRVNSKNIVIIDRQLGRMAQVEYASVNGIKQYRTIESTNLDFVTITGPQGKTWTAITRVPTPCELEENPDSRGVMLQGANANLSAGGLALAFPKVFTGSGQGMFYPPQSGPVLVTASYNEVFNSSETLSSNSASETIEAALDRYITFVQSLGYQGVSQRGVAAPSTELPEWNRLSSSVAR